MVKTLFPLVKNLIHYRTFIIVYLLSSTSLVQAQVLNQTIKTTTTPSAINYMEYLPPGYAASTDNYPVVFFFHGIGERGNTAAPSDMVRITYPFSPPKLVQQGTKFPFILITPQLKTSFGDWPPAYIDEVVEHIKSTLRIDTRRMYFTGMSLGGGGAWYYSHTYPGKVAALAPVCGSRNALWAACFIAKSNIPVWAFHGDKDAVVNYNQSVNMVNAIKACVPATVPTPLLTIYPNVGHNAWDYAYRNDNSLHTPNVYEWMMQFTNNGVVTNAGPDITLNLPTTSTTINGSASTLDGIITTYAWTKVSGGTAVMTNLTTPNLSLAGLQAGVYIFRLTATSSVGEAVYDDVKVTVLSGVNISPVANAGPDRTITLPTNSLTLNGSGSDSDGTISGYSWTKVSGPVQGTLSGANTATLGLSGLANGIYVFSLTVTDNQGANATDNVTVTVNNAPVNQNPTANAGPDKVVNLPTNSTNFVGSGSDPESGALTYLWEKVSGPASATIANPSLATATVNNLTAGNYIFRLTVTDNQGAKAMDDVNLTVIAANQSPTASAGPDITITDPTNTTNISGSGSDPDGSISGYVWTKLSGGTANLTNPNNATVTVTSLSVGTYVFRLTVTDNAGATAFDDVTVTVNSAPVNQAPVANAGPDKNITLPVNSVTMNGTGTDADGTISSYSWFKLSGPNAQLAGETTKDLTANSLIQGTYVFRLTVQDNQGATHTDDVTVTVQPAAVNQAPTANAGPDIVMTLPTNSTTLSGSGFDNDGSISAYTWTKVSGPAQGTPTGQTTSTLQLTNLTNGIYVWQLTVNDNQGATGSDQVSVTVNIANVGPSVNAGIDITLNLPTNSTTLTGSATDADGTVAWYSWTCPSCPTVPTISSPNSASTNVSGLGAGTYVFRLTATDDDGANGFDDVKVIVNAANLTPTANAGADQSITLPTTSTNFTGSATDPDGTITSYTWTATNWPGWPGGTAPTLSNSNNPTVTVSASVSGTYTFKLVVMDNGGAEDFDEVVLTVNAPVNQPPVANAGTNQSVTLPTNTLTMTGSGSDPDVGDFIKAYLWEKVSGPTVNLSNTTSATVTLNNLQVGVYTFRLTVTDNGNLTSSDEVEVTVLLGVNQPPIANAGPDQTISLPTDFTTLFGSGTDPDGSIQSYSWTRTYPTVVPGPTTANYSISGLVAGEYRFQLTITDNGGSSDVDEVIVTVNPGPATNQAPVANAGPDRSITLPTNSINLNGSGSDPNSGDVLSYSWIKVSGPSMTPGPMDDPTLSLSDLVQGTYIFRLTVTDDASTPLSSSDEVTVTVQPQTVNQPPIVDAGSDKEIFLPTNSVVIPAYASDADGSVTSYQWTQVSGATMVLLNDKTPTLTVNNLTAGTYVFRLTVADNQLANAFDDVIVTVNAATVNQPPIAFAGNNITIQLIGANTTTSATVNGSGTDADGVITGYLWTKISGPPVTPGNQNTPSLSLPDMVEGTYIFRLTVTDDDGDTDSDDVVITVLPENLPVPPSVNAGADVNVTRPLSGAVVLTGSYSDDGPITQMAWTQISGPSVTLTGSTTNTLSLTNLTDTTYVFRFTVTDNDNLTNFDEVSVTVFRAPAVPTVDAGENVLIQLPVPAVTITAVANSPQGLISSYKWIQTLGNPITILSDSTNALEIPNPTPGEYSFRITVKDGFGQEASDDVDLIVLDEIPSAQPSNVFSPNGDAIDPTWTIGNSFMLNNCEVIVYNRQGIKVFESIGYNTEWDGVFNGKPLPEGVYFYVIRCAGQKSKTGSVTIIR